MSYEQKSLACPYNPNHILIPSSFKKHIKKCKETNKHEFVQCDFNCLHIVRKEELRNHYENCVDKKQEERKKREYEWADVKEEKDSFQDAEKKDDFDDYFEKKEDFEDHDISFMSICSSIDKMNIEAQNEEKSLFREMYELFQKNGELEERLE